MYCWQLIFLQSKANGSVYHGDSLSTHSWQWPEGTWLQRRLYHLRETLNGYCRESPTKPVSHSLVWSVGIQQEPEQATVRLGS